MGTAIIFGLDISEQCSLTISGVAGANLPPVTVIAPSGRYDKDFADGSWSVTLAPTTYVLRIEESRERYIDEPAKLTVSVVVGGQPLPVTFVSKESSSGKRLAWVAATAGGSDPKDPWPPPVAPTSSDFAKWIGETLDDEERTMAVESIFRGG